MRTRNAQGFTLIELMVVIGILGLLAAVSVVAVITVFGGAKAKIDGQQLVKFQQKVALAAETQRNLFAGRGNTRGKFSELVKGLYDVRALRLEDIQLLAGGTGKEATEGDMQGELSTLSHVIFSGPNTGDKLLQGLKGSVKQFGVLFCYNKNFFNSHPDDGIVVLFPGGKDASPKVPSLIEEEYNKTNPDKQANFKGELKEMDDSFYGKPPFQNIVPE